MHVGITGGAGFIGGYVVEACLSRGHTVTTFDRTEHRKSPYVSPALTDASICSRQLGDIRDATAMHELAAHVDGIIHLAACLGTQETIKNPHPAADTNISGGLNFLDACAHYDIPGAYIAVGNHWMNNSYSITKTVIERFCDMYNTERGTNINVVRVVNAYGPRQSVAPPFGSAKVRKITPSFVCRALTNNPIEIYGDGQQISDMVSVRDAALALVLALESAAERIVFHRPVEIGPTEHFTVRDVAEKVLDAASKLQPVTSQITNLPMRPGEVAGAMVTADTSTLEFIGMKPENMTPFGDGIAETVSWYAEKWLPDYLTSQIS